MSERPTGPGGAKKKGIKILGVDIDLVTAKFILVGIINTIFGTTIMFVCYNVLHLSYWWSSAMNYFFGSILSFILNKYFTFNSKVRSGREVVRFVVNICACYLAAYGIAKPLASALLSNSAVAVKENVAMVIGMVFFVGLNYIGQRYFVFPEKNEAKSSDIK